MAIRSIMTTYLGNGGGEGALRMALQMARKYDAWITAVLWQAPNPMRNRPGSFFTREIDRVLDQAEAEFFQQRQQTFTASVIEAGLQDRAEFVEIKGRNANGIAQAAAGHDVVVMGSAPTGPRTSDFATRPDVVALRSGRPVLIVPPEYDAPAIVESAVVAWDGKRASARALADAMHILGTKDRVTLLGVGADLGPDYGQDVLRLLSRHGIDADLAVRPAGPGGIGRTILDACAELRAGQLVMGAYEHSKFSEDLLGGVTRDILETATLPVLMSH